MLNYILPPIIIVICSALLVMFLFKKAEKISSQEVILEKDLQPERKKTAIILSVLGQFWLRLLEKITQKIKLSSLKMHNASNDWFHSIREKRQRRTAAQQEVFDGKVPEGVREIKNDETQKIQIVRQAERIQVTNNQKQTVRETVAIEQKKVVENSKLEEVLIKRIAINPKDVEAYEMLGDYYLERRNFQDSLECFKQVLKLSPINYKARMKARRIEKIIR